MEENQTREKADSYGRLLFSPGFSHQVTESAKGSRVDSTSTGQSGCAADRCVGWAPHTTEMPHALRRHHACPVEGVDASVMWRSIG